MISFVFCSLFRFLIFFSLREKVKGNAQNECFWGETSNWIEILNSKDLFRKWAKGILYARNITMRWYNQKFVLLVQWKGSSPNAYTPIHTIYVHHTQYAYECRISHRWYQNVSDGLDQFFIIKIAFDIREAKRKHTHTSRHKRTHTHATQARNEWMNKYETRVQICISVFCELVARTIHGTLRYLRSPPSRECNNRRAYHRRIPIQSHMKSYGRV